jgi:cysteinyl-tRNA synthetase
MKYLGPQIDIHGGGDDLIFPHHESEIAQAEAYSGKVPFVSIWMHCAMVAYQGEKMSKSLGNLVYVQDLATQYSANAIRYFLLSHHYRTEWEFKAPDMEKAARDMETIEAHLHAAGSYKADLPYIKALSNDLNIPEALTYLMRADRAPGKQELFDLLGFVR